MFASQSGTLEKSVSVATPFHKYTTVAPLDTHSESSDSESDSEVYQLDDSGYHKNKMAMVSILNKTRDLLNTSLFSTTVPQLSAQTFCYNMSLESIAHESDGTTLMTFLSESIDILPLF